MVLLRSARIAEAEPYLDLGAAVAREHRLETAAYRIEAQQCYVLILRGHWDEAERRLRALLDAGDEPGANAVNPLAFLGRLLARRGDPAGAGFVERAWQLAEAAGEDQKSSVAAGARIEWLWLAGDTAPGPGRGRPAARGRGPRPAPVPARGDAALPAPGRRAGGAVPGLSGPVRGRASRATGRPRRTCGSAPATRTSRRWS